MTVITFNPKFSFNSAFNKNDKLTVEKFYRIPKTLSVNNIDKDLILQINHQTPLMIPALKLTYRKVKSAILYLDKFYDKNKEFKKQFYSIRNTLHPFGSLRLYINSTLVGKQKATNAFMKMYEFLEIFHPKFNSLFDIASSPGMFVIAAAHKRLSTYGDKLKWDACSYIPPSESIYLQDDYSLFSSNKDHFYNVNVLEDKDCQNLLKKVKKYDLVTGDIGSNHGYNDLQEDIHRTLQYRQAYLALNLVNKGGSIFLKMYTCINNNTIYLINVLSKHFEKFYLWKPYTSRILNNEIYIVGINKNDKIPDLDLNWKESYPIQENTQIFYNFFYKLAKKRLDLVKGFLKNNKNPLVGQWQQEMNPILQTLKHLKYKPVI